MPFVPFTVLQPLSVQRVWTSGWFLAYNDASGAMKWQDTPWFTPGQKIRYMVTVGNPSSAPVNVSFKFLATGPSTIWSASGSATVPVGGASYDMQGNVPLNAPAGTYTITITVFFGGTSRTGSGTFYVVGPPRTAGTTLSAGSPNPFAANYRNQCTYLADQEFSAFYGLYPAALLGHAYQWTNEAQSSGWTVTTTTQFNSVVVFPQDATHPQGHVAWVTGFSGSGSTIYVYEQNVPTGTGPRYHSYTVTSGMKFILVP